MCTCKLGIGTSYCNWVIKTDKNELWNVRVCSLHSVIRNMVEAN